MGPTAGRLTIYLMPASLCNASVGAPARKSLRCVGDLLWSRDSELRQQSRSLFCDLLAAASKPNSDLRVCFPSGQAPEKALLVRAEQNVSHLPLVVSRDSSAATAVRSSN